MSGISVSPLSSADSTNTKRKGRRQSRSSRKHNVPAPAPVPAPVPVPPQEELGEVCCICRLPFKGKIKKYVLTECKHVIHKNCVKELCKTATLNHRCPLCRSDIRVDCRELFGHKKGEMPGHKVSEIIKNEKNADLFMYEEIDEKRITLMRNYLLGTEYPNRTDFSKMHSFGQAILDKDRK